MDYHQQTQQQKEIKKRKKILINVKLPCSIESKQTKYLINQNYDGQLESSEKQEKLENCLENKNPIDIIDRLGGPERLYQIAKYLLKFKKIKNHQKTNNLIQNSDKQESRNNHGQNREQVLNFQISPDFIMPLETKTASQFVFQTSFYKENMSNQDASQIKSIDSEQYQIKAKVENLKKVDFEFEAECLADICFPQSKQQQEFIDDFEKQIVQNSILMKSQAEDNSQDNQIKNQNIKISQQRQINQMIDIMRPDQFFTENHQFITHINNWKEWENILKENINQINPQSNGQENKLI